jgi:hypothetical protein
LNTTTGAAIKIPTVDDTAVTAVDQHSEGTALTDDGGSDVTFGQKSLDSYGFDTEFVRFSLELARDSCLNMENLLGLAAGRASRPHRQPAADHRRRLLEAARRGARLDARQDRGVADRGDHGRAHRSRSLGRSGLPAVAEGPLHVQRH